MKTLDLTVPSSWHELGDDELRYVYSLIAQDFDSETVKTLCLLRWSGVKVVGHQSGDRWLLQKGDDFLEVSPLQLAQVLPAMDWLSAPPTAPVRPRKLRGAEALPADFQGVPLETYIVVDNLFQGYLATSDDGLLDELAAVLYPQRHGSRLRPGPEGRIAVFFWVTSLKEFLARKFPDFFQPAGSAFGENLLASSPSAEDAMNAMIRALTKGDVTKEREILALDTWRALTELNAMAREYRQLDAQMKSK